MQSFLISSKDREEALKKAALLCLESKIDKIDTDTTYFEKSVGIEDVRIIQKKIYLKPLKSEAKAIILDAYSGLTIEAQNSLLKILEEPPNNTIIIVLVETDSQILPTILSRCKNIRLDDKREKLGELEEAQVVKALSSLYSSGDGVRLKLAQDFGKSREEAIIWLEKMIIILRKNIIEEIDQDTRFEQSKPRTNNLTVKTLKYSSDANLANSLSSEHEIVVRGKVKILQKIQDTYTIIKTTNINQRFALENLFLSI